MDNSENNRVNKKNNVNGITPEKYAYLRAEAEAPYRGLRKFIYVGIGASGLIGGFVFLAQLVAGKNVQENVLNLVIQISVITLMILLFRWESRDKSD